MRALLTATFVLPGLLLAAPQATASPPPPADPPDILTPAVPPDPQPCQARPAPCDLTAPTASPTSPPTTTVPAEPTETTEAAPGHDTGSAAGPARTTPPVKTTQPDSNWWLVAVPVLALLALAAAGAFLLIQRTERRPS